MIPERFLTRDELQAGLDEIRRAPQDAGRLEMISRRPDMGEREVLTEAQLDVAQGLVGDNWLIRGSSSTPDGAANPGAQLTLMNVRVADLVAQDPTRRILAGDQLYVDLDLSVENLPPGTRLAIGGAIVEVSDVPHPGCPKFTARFGVDAMKFVNTPEGKDWRLRGMNTKVVQGGTIRVGDRLQKL